MDWLLARQEGIEKRLAKRHLSDGARVLYDLSSSYFEGERCPLAKRGYSRDGKKGKLQVNYGLLTDARGCPVAISVFPGNSGDPTTLLAQVDSSVGGKTGVNHPLGKNMIGAFHQPRCVIADTDTLNTLPDRELSAGLAEVIKYGLINDPDFFAWLENNMAALIAREPDALAYAIERSCSDKAEVVAADEKEAGQRALLNLGHTFGHAIENGMGYGQWLHGEAIGAGMCMAARFSVDLGLMPESDAQRTVDLVGRARLPVEPPSASDIDSTRFLQLMSVDKKVQDGQLRLVLMQGIGKAFIASDFSLEALAQSLDRMIPS